MALISNIATKKISALLTGPSGLPAVVSQVAQDSAAVPPVFSAGQVVSINAAAEIADKAFGLSYPSVQVYCSKLTNSLREKFRTFSGEAQMIAEVRISHDRLEQVEPSTQLMADAVTQVLDASRGDLGDGVYYAGGYEVQYTPIKPGGRRFLQTAKVSFSLQVSI